MAARKNLHRPLGKMHDAKTREKIQTTQIVKRLTEHVLGEAEMKATQVRAAEILLNKVLPNMTAVAGVDGEGNIVPVTFNMNLNG